MTVRTRLTLWYAGILTASLLIMGYGTYDEIDEQLRHEHRRAPTEHALGEASEMVLQIGLPAVVTNRHIFNQYVIRIKNRDELQSYLKQKGVGTEVYYPVPLHLQECFAYLGYKAGAFPESERAAKETLALPVYPELTDAQAQYVVDCICEFVAKENTALAAR